MTLTKKLCVFFFLFVSSFSWIVAQSVTPVGKWLTVNYATGKVRSHIELWLDNKGTLRGNLVRIIERKKFDDEFCHKCKDDRKGHKIEGIEFLRQMVKKDNDSRYWHKGKALDAQSGKEYDCLIKMEQGNDSLEFRCYIGTPAFGRSEFWQRIQ